MRKVHGFDDGWRFSCGERGSVPLTGSGLRPVRLPHCWEVGPAFNSGVYKNNFFPNMAWMHKEIYLEIGGCGGRAKIIFNDAEIGASQSPVTPFLARLTGLVRWTRENTLLVIIDCDEADGHNPGAARFAGLYGGARILEMPATHFSPDYGNRGVTVTPSLNRGGGARVRVSCAVTQADDGIVARLTLLRPNGEPCRQRAAIAREGFIIDEGFDLPDPQLWDGPGSPMMYTVRAQLFRDNACVDDIRIPFGIREAGCVGDAFALNGKPFGIKGICRYADHPTMGWATGEAVDRLDISAVTRMGANAVMLMDGRVDEAMLSVCDNAGVVVWAQLPKGGAEAASALAQWQRIYHTHPSLCGIVAGMGEGFPTMEPGNGQFVKAAILPAPAGQLPDGADIAIVPRAEKSRLRPSVLMTCCNGNTASGESFREPVFLHSLSGYCKTGEGSQASLLSPDRSDANESGYICMARWTTGPMARIMLADGHVTADRRVGLRVISNCERLSLIINGKAAGRLTGGPPEYFCDAVPLSRGENTITAISPDGTLDEITVVREADSMFSRLFRKK